MSGGSAAKNGLASLTGVAKESLLLESFSVRLAARRKMLGAGRATRNNNVHPESARERREWLNRLVNEGAARIAQASRGDHIFGLGHLSVECFGVWDPCA